MANKDLTELVFILDRSGSMRGMEDDTIGGFNGLMEKQRALAGEAVVTTVLFDDRVEVLHDRIPLGGLRLITREEYFVRGSTALLDAVGLTLERVIQTRRHTLPDAQPAHTLVAITTDGMENASRRFTFPQIRKLIGQQRAEFGWEFLFLGADIDALDTATDLGIGADRATNYMKDASGAALGFAAMQDAAQCVRSCGSVQHDWKKAVEQDHAKRSRKP